MEYILHKFDELGLKGVWFILSFIGVVLAIGSMRIESITLRRVVQIVSSGLACGIALPVLVRDVGGYDSISLQSVAAMLGGYFGLWITAKILKFDPQEALTKRFGK